jgi:hypothetical protein
MCPVGLLIVCATLAQDAASLAAFEAVSVRPAAVDDRRAFQWRGGPRTDAPDVIYATSINLSGLIQRAYELEIYQFVYAP